MNIHVDGEGFISFLQQRSGAGNGGGRKALEIALSILRNITNFLSLISKYQKFIFECSREAVKMYQVS